MVKGEWSFFAEPDGDEYSRRTSAERRSALKWESDQLAEINAEIRMIDERIHALSAVIHHSDQGDDVSEPVRDGHDDYEIMGAAASVRCQ